MDLDIKRKMDLKMNLKNTLKRLWIEPKKDQKSPSIEFSFVLLIFLIHALVIFDTFFLPNQHQITMTEDLSQEKIVSFVFLYWNFLQETTQNVAKKTNLWPKTSVGHGFWISVWKLPSAKNGRLLRSNYLDS